MATAHGLRAAAVTFIVAGPEEETKMKRLNQLRTAAFLVLSVVLAATTASADPGTVTITGNFTMDELNGTVGDDLADLYEEGAKYTWTLTLYGTTYSHWSYAYGRITDVYATSFDLQFSGPNGDALTQIMSEELAGGEVGLELKNFVSSGTAYGATMMLWLVSPEGYSAGLSLWAGHESDFLSFPFPVDASGYPTLESDPFDFWVEGPYIIDNRPGSSGSIGAWYNDATISGDIGSPIPVKLSIGDASVVEGDRGTAKAMLSVRLSNTSDQTVTVNYRTVDGTAISGGGKNKSADYGATSGTLTFQPGEIGKTITISIKSDRKAEPNETFTVELYGAVGATIDDGVATVTIVNDD